METISNEEKANEIARDMLPYNNAEYHACYNSAMKAMQWKDEKFEKQGERKITWSDVDELMLNSTIYTLKIINGTQLKIDWLNSIKKRMKGE